MARNGLAHRLYVGDLAYEFIGRRKIWYAISGALIAISLIALLVRGLSLGIEFTGGASFRAPAAGLSQPVATVRSAVKDLNLPKMDDLAVTTVSNDISVQTRSLSVDEVTKVREAIAKATNVAPEKVAYSLIGASWGKQITQQGLIGLLVFILLVMLLIGLYFREAKMSIAAILALAHDLIITLGIYALIGFTVTPATLIGVLTILGYSLYDTVVVFDKVRENTRDLAASRRTYSQAANRAVNQVLVRSVNTTIIGVLPVAAILFAGAFILGSGPLKDLGLALFIGMIVGAYSSIFIATPVLVQLKEAEPEMKQHREHLARLDDRGTRRTKPTAGRAAAVADAGAEQPATTKPAPRTPPSRPASAKASGRPQPERRPRSERKG